MEEGEKKSGSKRKEIRIMLGNDRRGKMPTAPISFSMDHFFTGLKLSLAFFHFPFFSPNIIYLLKKVLKNFQDITFSFITQQNMKFFNWLFFPFSHLKIMFHQPFFFTQPDPFFPLAIFFFFKRPRMKFFYEPFFFPILCCQKYFLWTFFLNFTLQK